MATPGPYERISFHPASLVLITMWIDSVLCVEWESYRDLQGLPVVRQNRTALKCALALDKIDVARKRYS